MISKLRKNDFVKSVSILLSGTIISQLLNYLFVPILSRIYEVEEMADLSLFFRITGFIIGIGTARLEYTLPLPKREAHSFLLYRISLRISMIVLLCGSLVGTLWLLVKPFNWYNFLFVLLVVIGSFFSIIINLGVNWSIRNNTFKLISRSRILNAFIANMLKLGFAYLKLGSLGLILGTTLAYIGSSLHFIKEYLSKKKLYKHEYSKAKQFALLKEYKHFPLINLPHSLIDLGRDLIVAFLIVFYFGKEVFGHYSYSIMILNVPISLIGVSIAQVFFNKVSKMVNEGLPIYALVKKMMTLLLMIAIIPFGILYFFAEDIFATLLGDIWRKAGTYSEIMIFYFMFNFLVSPLSQLPFVLNRQKELFFAAIVHSAGQVLLFGLLPLVLTNDEVGFKETLGVVVVFQSIMMLVNMGLYLRYSKIYSNRVMSI